MMGKRRLPKWIVKGRHASIVDWDLTFRVRTREQVVEFLRIIKHDDVLFDAGVEFRRVLGPTDSENHYEIHIECCWANNLERLGALLAKYVDCTE